MCVYKTPEILVEERTPAASGFSDYFVSKNRKRNKKEMFILITS